MLSAEQIEQFGQQGYLRLRGVFREQLGRLSADLDWVIEEWAERSPGWSGPWRRVYMDATTEQRSKLIAMHDLHFYSDAWMRAVSDADLCAAVSQLVGGPVELHHSTLHVKPPETGHPFPMHQDWPFYPHTDGRFVGALVHLDDTCHDNGELRFLDGSHRSGPLSHVTETEAGGCSPHLPTDSYRLEQATPVGADAGDVILFSIHAVHGSYINRTDRLRRLVRIGYRHPDNRQTGGQSHGRPGLMVRGRRTRGADQPLFSTAGPG